MRQSAGKLTPLLIGAMVATAVIAPIKGHAVDQADQVLAASCRGCHMDSEITGGIPSLQGQSAKQLETLLLAYKHGSREGTLMDRIARGYSDDELKRIAAALASDTAR